MNQQTRGERNCNPGNLRRTSTVWQGMTANQPDPSFITFATPQAGIRALARTLHTYYHLHKLTTVEQIITRWAPTNENDTQSYVNHVAQSMGVEPDENIDPDNPVTMEALVRGIILHENGRCIYDQELIAGAVDSALGVA